MFTTGGPLQKALFRQRPLLAGSVTVMLSQVLLLVLLPLPIRAALDRLTGATAGAPPYGLSQPEFLAALTLTALAIGLLSSFFEYLEDRATATLSRNALTELRTSLIDEVLTRRMEYLDRKRKVDLLGRISGDVQNLELYFTTLLSVLVRSVPSVVFVIGAMLILQWSYALALVAVLLLVAFVTARLARRIKGAEKLFRRSTVALEQDLLQSLTAMPLIKSFQAEGRTTRLLLSHQRATNHAFDEVRRLSASMSAIFSSGRYVLRALVMLVGGWAVLRGRMTLGTLFAFLTYLEALNKPLMEIANCFSRLNKASASRERIEEMRAELSAAPELRGQGTLLLDNSEPPLALEKVTFSYEGGGEIFSGLSLAFTRGLVAVAGESGAGKSTLIRLLNRLVDPSRGELRIAGQSMGVSQLSEVRRHVCVISQDPFILSTTVAENLRWSLDEPLSEAELWEALEKVSASQFVRELPRGLETLVGEGGLQLSGGQAKRLSLARGFLRACFAEVLVFDEPTSGLDPISAQTVIDSLSILAEQKSLVLFSTHRLTELSQAQEVLFLSRAAAPLFGRHDELLAQSTSYRDFARELVEVKSEPALHVGGA